MKEKNRKKHKLSWGNLLQVSLLQLTTSVLKITKSVFNSCNLQSPPGDGSLRSRISSLLRKQALLNL